MAVEVPSVIDDVDTPAFVQRRATQALTWGPVGSFAGGVGARNGWAHGIAHPTHLKVTQTGTPGMAVEVSAGQAFITGTVSAEQGVYVFTSPTAETRTIAPADATNPRRDLVIARIVDPQYAGAEPAWDIVVVTGTPAPTPSDPSLAAYPNALVLTRVAVAANATSITNANLTDLRVMGGPMAGLPVSQASNTAQSFPDNAPTTANFTVADHDPYGWWTSGNASRITPTIAGWYEVTVHYDFVNAGNWSRLSALLLKSGSTQYQSEEAAGSAATLAGAVSTCFPLVYANGTSDYFQVQILQDNTDNQSRAAAVTMTVKLVGAVPA